MRNISKMTTLENKFPLLAVEHGCIVSKDADLTVAYEVELPELYTVTGAEYEAIHGCWCKAIKVLPDYSIVHKQDWFIKERYQPELHKDDMSFLSRNEIKTRQCVYISRDVHGKILRIVNDIAGGEISVGGYVDTVLRQHLEQHKERINELYKKQREDLI